MVPNTFEVTINTRAAETVSMDSKRYLVACDDCSFSDTVIGREDAIAVGESHNEESDHEITALEFPKNPRVESSSH